VPIRRQGSLRLAKLLKEEFRSKACANRTDYTIFFHITAATRPNVLRDGGYTIRDAPLVSGFEGFRHGLFTVQRFELAQVHSVWWLEFSAACNS
jgi:hypothetical protein